MPSKWPVLKPSEVDRALNKLGFHRVSQRGSHIKYTDGVHVTIVPEHREIAKGTLKGILDKADISYDRFMSALKD